MQQQKMERIHYKKEDSVLCNIEIDSQFLKDMREIVDKRKAQNQQIVSNEAQSISPEEYDSIHEKAQMHAQANILNVTTSKELKDIIDEQRCTCGCGKGIGDLLPLLTNQQNLSILGSGIILLFFYLRHMRMLMFFVFMVYGVMSLFFYRAYQPWIYKNCSEEDSMLIYGICTFNQNINFGMICQNIFLMNFQIWLGFCMCIFWLLGLNLISALGARKDREVDDSLESASDYTIKIDNLPYGQYDEEQLIDYIKQLWVDEPNTLDFESIQIVYNMEEEAKAIDEIGSLSQNLIECLEENNFRFSNTIQDKNVQKYRTFKKQIIKRIEFLEKGRRQFQQNSQIRKKKSTNIAFLQFTTPEQKREFLKVVEPRKNPIADTFLPAKNALFKHQNLIISRAPEPSDIIWSNCQKPSSMIRSGIIWLITMLVLYIGYAIISYFQTLDFVRETEGIVTSTFLQLFNRVIWFQLSVLVAYDYNNTKTQAIISLMKRSMIAQAINIILTPVISFFVNNRSLYGDLGLSGMALTYQFVMLIMMVFIYILNPFYLIKYFSLKITCIRNKIMRRYLRGIEQNITIDQIKDILTYYEGPQFPVAGGFVYMTTAMFHSLFFCHLQPILLIFVTLNMSLFFLLMKYLLFRRCKIPELTNIQVFQFAMFALSFGALFYGCGSLFFLVIDEKLNIKTKPYLLIPSILVLIIWFAFNLNFCGLPEKFNNWLLQSLENTSKKTKKKKKKQFRGTINIQNLNSHVSEVTDLQVWSRRQSYYRQCNTNKLFEFESFLLDAQDQFRSSRGQSLRKFSQSFFQKNNVIELHESGEMLKVKGNKSSLVPVVIQDY